MTCKMSVQIRVFYFAFFAFVGGDPDCERRRVSWNDMEVKDGFKYPLPHARGAIYISQNRTNIARANFKAAPPTFIFTDDVIRMDDTSIVTKHFADIKMEYKWRNESRVFMGCVFYETHEGPDESEPMNFTGSFPDNNKRPQLRIGVICTVVLLLVIFICAVLWKTVMRDHNGDGTPDDCCFIRGQLPTPCPRADDTDLV